MNALQGMAAQVRPATRVLVLGSLPGAASLAAQRYYAHPRNRFWPVMGALTGLDEAADYTDRIAALLAAGVGVWDVLASARRQGSLDVAIERGSEQVNDLPALLDHLPALQVIACNGGTAARLYGRHLQAVLEERRPALQFFALPSTSPANAACSLPALITAWSVIAPWLHAGCENAATAHKKP